MNLIEVNHLEKIYHPGSATQVHALKGIRFQLEKGDMCALMGVSGSGKTTLLNILGFMDRPSAGEYYFKGKNVLGLSDRALARYRNEEVGFIMQNYGLILPQTAFENVSLPLLLGKKVPCGEIKKRVSDLLEEVGLEEKTNVPVEQISGGQQQRVAIARAMANHPSLLIADEPTGALDSETAGEIMNLFLRMNREAGVTVLIATHDAHVAKACHRALRIDDGRLA